MYRLPDISLPIVFPDDFETTREGLLAIGGNLHPETLVDAYSKGIFPWFSEGDPILWWHPNPRSALLPDQLHISSKFRRFLKKTSQLPSTHFQADKANFIYHVTINSDFKNVITSCATKERKGQNGTWITKEIEKAYIELYKMGYAHSIEVWDQKSKLVGGMYGIAIGKIFFGESMFSHETNASKTALFWLCKLLTQHNFLLLDCQVESKHMNSLGTKSMSRKVFMDYLKKGNTHHKQKSSIFSL